MVDESLPFVRTDRRPLRHLFLDLNSYFASVEQQERPELRGKPVGVGAVMTDTSCIIAASYEAKRFGVKTGTSIRDAKRLCPEIILVDGDHKMYTAYHQRVMEVAESVLPVTQECSIDELRFELIGIERKPACALEIARKLKGAIRRELGECLTSSIGIAPNAFLAKLGTELQKPDGLVMLQADDLPHRLHGLKLTDFPGINKRMEVHLNAAGIFTAEQLCGASREHLWRAFGSLVGERWYYLLRGYDLPAEHGARKTLGHSHVLPPDLRTDDGCREVLLRLLHKAAARLRQEQLWARGMHVGVDGFKRDWSAKMRLPPTQDSMTLTEYAMEAWQTRCFVGPHWVGVTFYDLMPAEQVTPSLFDATMERSLLSHAVDRVNRKFGKNKVYLAGMDHAKDTAPERIAFNKTWLFSEGKGDNELPEIPKLGGRSGLAWRR